jgi:linoleoyl-CoA desaturase
MPSSEFPVPDEAGLLENNWSLHQLSTTTNFSPKNRWFSWLIGGLNYQIEHHLLPNISHVHYRDLSVIVKQTAEEFGLPYHTRKDFLTAIADHTRMLRDLGKKEMVTAVA